jgi:Flp pilus assembly protein TadG
MQRIQETAAWRERGIKNIMQRPFQPNTRRSGRGRRGAVALLVALTVAVLMGFTGMAVDLGMMWNMKRQVQTAADAAALAAGTQLRRGGSYAAAARDLSSLNGFTDGSNGTVVTVNRPPASGTYAGQAGLVEVIVAKNQPTYFMRYLGASAVTIRGRAVAGGASGNFCVYTLDPTSSGARTTTRLAHRAESWSTRIVRPHLRPQVGLQLRMLGLWAIPPTRVGSLAS